MIWKHFIIFILFSIPSPGADMEGKYEESMKKYEGIMKDVKWRTWRKYEEIWEFIANRLYSKEEEALNFSKSQGLYRGGGELSVFLCPKASGNMKGIWRKYAFQLRARVCRWFAEGLRRSLHCVRHTGLASQPRYVSWSGTCPLITWCWSEQQSFACSWERRFSGVIRA